MAYCYLHNVNLSSDCDRYDTVCGQCESEMDMEQNREEWLALSPQEKHRHYEILWALKKERLYCVHMHIKGDCIICYPDEILF